MTTDRIPDDLAPADLNHPITQDVGELGRGAVAALGAIALLSLAARIEPGQVEAAQKAIGDGLAEYRFLVVIRGGAATIEGQLRYPDPSGNPARDVHREALVHLRYAAPTAH